MAELEAQRNTLESANTELREAAARCEAAEAEAKTATARAEAEAQAKTVAEGALSGVREELREAKLAAGESGADKAALVSPPPPQQTRSIESYLHLARLRLRKRLKFGQWSESEAVVLQARERAAAESERQKAAAEKRELLAQNARLIAAARK